MYQPSHQPEGVYIANYGDRVIHTTTSNDKASINNMYCYPTNNDNEDKFILTTRKLIYTDNCGQKKNNNIAIYNNI